MLLYNGVAYANIPVGRASLLKALPASPYVAIRTLRRGTKLTDVETNLRRLLTSAAATLGAASDTGGAPPETQDGGWSPLAEEFERFRARAWKDLRVLLRLCHCFTAQPALQGKPAATTAVAAAANDLLLPEGCEISVTMALTQTALPEAMKGLGFPPHPAASLPAATQATPTPPATTEADPSDKGATAACPSQPIAAPTSPLDLHLVLLAEPLIPSRAIFHGPPQQQPQPQQQQQQQQSLPGLSEGTPSHEYIGSISSSSSNSSSTTTHKNSIRWCNVLLLSHGGRAQPGVKSTDWASARQPLLREAHGLEAVLKKPIEEVLLERDGCLLEGG